MSSQKLLCRVLLVFAFAALPVAPAAAQVSEPEFVPYVNDMQAFDQPDLSSYGRGTSPPAGWFGSAEYLNWSQVAPTRSLIGQAGPINVISDGAATVNSGDNPILVVNPFGYVLLQQTQVTSALTGITVVTRTFQTFAFSTQIGTTPSTAQFGTVTHGEVPQNSTLDTTFMSSSDYTSGGRFEFGRVDEDGRGWMIGGFNLSPISPSQDSTNTPINFENSPIGFIDTRGQNSQGPDGYDDDLDNDGVYGRFGIDLGSNWTVPTTGQILQGVEPLNGVPDNQGVPTDFDDAVRLPTVFSSLHVENRTSTYGVEVMRMWRVAMGPRGGVWETFAGPRGLNVNDEFIFDGIGEPNRPGTRFNTNAQNYIFGGQLGGRWSRTQGRLQVNLEGRMLAAANYQHVTQTGEVGSLGVGVVPTAVINVQVPANLSNTVNQTVFSPAGELRFNMKYHLFRSLYLQAGYTALYVDGIARGAQMTRYSLPSMGILEDQNRSSLFLQGLNIGMVFNH